MNSLIAAHLYLMSVDEEMYAYKKSERTLKTEQKAYNANDRLTTKPPKKPYPKKSKIT